MTLYAHQLDGIRFLAARPAALLADDGGLLRARVSSATAPWEQWVVHVTGELHAGAAAMTATAAGTPAEPLGVDEHYRRLAAAGIDVPAPLRLLQSLARAGDGIVGTLLAPGGHVVLSARP